ncbi:MAG: hypothetical protein LBL96_05640 [Clostridiales bacterium]|jgi:hypothetical protein|nr:hypothetical protein [Clostridiales bacterium]
MKRAFSNLVWQELHWSRLFQYKDVLKLLTHIATLSPRKTIIWEVHSQGGQIRYLVGTEKRYFKFLKAAFKSHGNMKFVPVKTGERENVTICKQLRISKPLLSLNTDNVRSVLKIAFAALANTKESETLVLQIVLGQSFAPLSTPDKAPNHHATTMLGTLLGKTGVASKENQAFMQDKSSQHSFLALIRLGAAAESKLRSNNLLQSLTGGFCRMEAPGVKLATYVAKPEDLNTVHIPWYLPLKLTITELSCFVLLPFGNMLLPGQSALHPKLLRPSIFQRNPASEQNRERNSGKNPENEQERNFGVSTCAGPSTKRNITPTDSFETSFFPRGTPPL